MMENNGVIILIVGKCWNLELDKTRHILRIEKSILNNTNLIRILEMFRMRIALYQCFTSNNLSKLVIFRYKKSNKVIFCIDLINLCIINSFFTKLKFSKKSYKVIMD